MKTPKKIALFGGSFDPIHLGHVKLLEEALLRLRLDHIYLIPCKQSPHKKNAPIATDQQRLDLCRIATSHLEKVSVSDIEIHRPSPSFSWMTVEHFLRTHPGCELYWIMGTDQWEMIEKWARFDFLRNSLNFIIVERQNSVQHKDEIHYQVLPFNQEISSTQIRTTLRTGKTTNNLCQKTLEYIREQKLYLD